MVIIAIPAPLGVLWVVSMLSSILLCFTLSKASGRLDLSYPWIPVSIILSISGLTSLMSSLIYVSLSQLYIFAGKPLIFCISIFISVVFPGSGYIAGIHNWSVFSSVSHIHVFMDAFFVPALSFYLNSMVDWFICFSCKLDINLLLLKTSISLVYPSKFATLWLFEYFISFVYTSFFRKMY